MEELIFNLRIQRYDGYIKFYKCDDIYWLKCNLSKTNKYYSMINNIERAEYATEYTFYSDINIGFREKLILEIWRNTNEMENTIRLIKYINTHKHSYDLWDIQFNYNLITTQ
jgi:hypothetical protein